MTHVNYIFSTPELCKIELIIFAFPSILSNVMLKNVHTNMLMETELLMIWSVFSTVHSGLNVILQLLSNTFCTIFCKTYLSCKAKRADSCWFQCWELYGLF